jgi:hypothetical protein
MRRKSNATTTNATTAAMYTLAVNKALTFLFADMFIAPNETMFVLFVLLFCVSSWAQSCSTTDADSFAECLKSNACGTHDTAEQKCDCYRKLANCYKDSLGRCVTKESFIEFQRLCVRNAGCALSECNDASPRSLAALSLVAASVALFVQASL